MVNGQEAKQYKYWGDEGSAVPPCWAKILSQSGKDFIVSYWVQA